MYQQSNRAHADEMEPLIMLLMHLLELYGDTINSLIYAGNSKDVMTTKISWFAPYCDWLDLLINVIGNPYLGFVIERVLLCYFVFQKNRLTQWVGS